MPFGNAPSLDCCQAWYPPAETLVWGRTKEDFIARIQDGFTGDALDDPDEAVAAVFSLLDRHVSHGEIGQVRNSMKKSLRDLWSADCPVAPKSPPRAGLAGNRPA